MQKIDTSNITRQQWLALRSKYIGGSDAPIITNKSKFSSPYQLAHEKLGIAPDREETDEMRYGSRMEDLIFDCVEDDYYRLTGGNVSVVKDKHMFIDGWRSANIDGFATIETDMTDNLLSYEAENGDLLSVYTRSGVEGILEIKAPGSYAVSDWKTGVPQYYEDQGYHYMDVIKKPFVLWVAWCGAKIFIHIQKSDEQKQAELREKEQEFYENVMLKRIIPEPSFQDFDYVKTFEAFIDDVLDVSEFDSLVDRIQKLKSDIKVLEKEKQELETQIRTVVGNHKKAESDKYVITKGRQFLIKEK